jgi:beta-galactosidase/beta-glucuronidase
MEQHMRQTTTLSSGWKFHLGDLEYAYYKGYDDSGWRPVTLPHDWSVESPFDQSYSSGTGYVCGGVGWYRLRFVLPEDVTGKAVWATFGGVYKNARIWCNTNYLGMRPSGYATFTHDITPFAQPGENVLAVRAEHSDLADSRWFTGNGIYRDVTLTVADKAHFLPDGVFVSTAAADEAQAELRVEWELSEAAAVSFALGGAHVNAAGRTGVATLRVDQPRLWSPDSPALYTLACRAGEDELEIPCGIRTFNFDPDTGFTLNGNNMKLKGVCLHHDAGALGAAVPKCVWRRRLRKLKAAGCNAIRTAHNPPDSHLLDLCDEMGFLVMDEAFDEWEGCKNKWWQGHNVYPPKHSGYADAFPVWHARDLADMVRRDRNHPSVILWSIGNEIDYPNDPYCHPLFQTMTGNNDANKPAQERQYDPDKPNAQRLATVARRLVSIVKEHDATRPVTAALAFPELSNRIGYAQALDVIGYNYKEQLYAQDRQTYPGHVIYGSENGHAEEQWRAVRDNPAICGQFLWTGIDYLGEAHGWPVRLSPAGLLTTAGFENPRYYHRKAMWTDALMVYLDATAENQAIVYTNAERVELFCDGQSLGAQDVRGCSAAFALPFEPGALRAVAARGDEIAEAVLALPGALAEIRLTAELGEIAQVEVSLRDAHGRPVLEDVTLGYSLTGEGEILGIDNGRPDDLTPYASPTRATFHGRAVAYVRLNGSAALHVAAPGGVTAYVEILGIG